MAVNNQRKRLLAILTVAWLLYAVACLVPAFDLKDSLYGHGPPVGALPGWYLLFPGFVILAGAFSPGLFPLAWAWLANPMLVIGSVLLGYRRPRSAIVAACLALLLSAGCWIPSRLEHRQLPGYYVWVASMGVLAIGAWSCLSVVRAVSSKEVVTEPIPARRDRAGEQRK